MRKKCLKKNDYVIVQYEKKHYPGQVMEVKGTKYKIKCMVKCGLAWKWPAKEDLFEYDLEEVKCQIEEPLPINSRGHFKIKGFPEEN